MKWFRCRGFVTDPHNFPESFHLVKSRVDQLYGITHVIFIYMCFGDCLRSCAVNYDISRSTILSNH